MPTPTAPRHLTNTTGTPLFPVPPPHDPARDRTRALIAGGRRGRRSKEATGISAVAFLATLSTAGRP